MLKCEKYVFKSARLVICVLCKNSLRVNGNQLLPKSYFCIDFVLFAKDAICDLLLMRFKRCELLLVCILEMPHILICCMRVLLHKAC